MADKTRSKEVDKLVDLLQLQPHPEGGYFKETYRSEGFISSDDLAEIDGNRNYSTAIYFLLTSDSFSAFHRIKQDELWHFYQGETILIHEIKPTGVYIKHQLGSQMEEGIFPQICISANSWFASEVSPEGKFGLVGCTVSPGFDFRDFELANATDLSAEFPKHKELISRLCR